MGNSIKHEESPLLIKCNFCDTGGDIFDDHYTSDCESLQLLKKTNKSLKIFLRLLHLEVWAIEGIIRDIIILYKDHLMFYIIGHEQPLFFFNSKIDTDTMRKLNKVVKLCIYPCSDLKPSQMVRYFVYELKVSKNLNLI